MQAVPYIEKNGEGKNKNGLRKKIYKYKKIKKTQNGQVWIYTTGTQDTLRH